MGSLHQFAFSFGGNIAQANGAGGGVPSPTGMPPATQPVLPAHSLAEAFEDGEPDLFRVLRWDYGLVETLYGRDAERQAILEWARSPTQAATVRLVTGEGGAGKTRLAATVARELRAEGWTAGFLPRSEAVLFDVDPPGLFLILDYPEEQPVRTHALLARLADWQDGPYPIRLLLLSRRSAQAWEREAEVMEGRFARQAVAVPDSLAQADALGLIKEAVGNFAQEAGCALPDLSTAADWLARSPENALPLFAAAAAVHAVLAPDDPFGLGGGDLLRDLARRERRRVHHASKAVGLGDAGLERLLALAVLADGLAPPAIRELVSAGAAQAPAGDVVDLLSGTSWWRDGRLAPLQPDRPAAAFVDLALFPKALPVGHDRLPDWLFPALRDGAATLGDRLSRIFYDLAALERTAHGSHPLDVCLAEMLRRDPTRAAAFEVTVKQRAPHWAAGFGAAVLSVLADQAANPEDRARLLGNLSVHLSDLGEREAALAATQEAVELHRALADLEPDAFTSHLARSLTNLGVDLSALGRREEALAATQEAVELRRALADAHPDVFTPDLARSLINLGGDLADLGLQEEALAVTQEATEHFRDLARDRPDAFTHNLAVSLNNLGKMLSDVGRHEAALAAIQEAVQLYRNLTDTHPDAFTHHLARSLNNLGNALSAVGQREEALSVTQEAVEFRRALARARPEAFSADLAASLNNLGIRLSGVGRSEEALAAAREAVELCRGLARTRPDVSTPDLVRSLTNLGNRLWGLGRRKEALAATEEAVRSLRPFFLRNSAAFASLMATVVGNYREVFNATGRSVDEDLLGPIVEILDADAPD